MKLDKFTHGNTPAAIYLVDRLNELDSPKFARKLATVITEVRAIIRQTITAQSDGAITISMAAFIANALRDRVVKANETMLSAPMEQAKSGAQLPDVLAINLATNLMIGEVKSITRRGTTAVHLQKNQQRSLSKFAYLNPALDRKLVSIEARPIKITNIKEDITPETLQKKSRAKLVKQGKPNTFY